MKYLAVRNSTDIVANIDGGLQPVWSIVAEKALSYSSKVMKYPLSYLPKIAMEEQLSLGTRSPYIKYLIKWKKATNTFGLDDKTMKDNILKAAIDDVMNEKITNSTSSFPMNCSSTIKRSNFFRPKWWVNDSGFCKIFAEFRSCNSSPGNCGPTEDGRFFKLCRLCSKKGITAINNEVKSLDIKILNNIKMFQIHMIVDCAQLDQIRSTCSLGHFISTFRRLQPNISSLKIYAMFLNDRFSPNHKDKILSLYQMKLGWMKLMGIKS